jgi:hypothetical protein
VNAIINEPISNRDPRYAGVMAELETDDAREDFLAYQRANFMRLAQVFIAAHSEEFETFTWEMYAQVKGEA